MLVWSFVSFPMLDARASWSTIGAVSVGLFLHEPCTGEAACFSELSARKVRYSGASIGYQLASIAAGGIAPLIATALFTGTAQPGRSRSTWRSPAW